MKTIIINEHWQIDADAYEVNHTPCIGPGDGPRGNSKGFVIYFGHILNNLKAITRKNWHCDDCRKLMPDEAYEKVLFLYEQ